MIAVSTYADTTAQRMIPQSYMNSKLHYETFSRHKAELRLNIITVYCNVIFNRNSLSYRDNISQ